MIGAGLYAASTKRTPAERQAEIEEMLSRYGASHFAVSANSRFAAVVFRAPSAAGAYFVRIEIALPDATAPEFASGRRSHERALRQRWAATALFVRAKLEAVLAGIETFESAFLGALVMPNGLTFAEWARPQLAAASSVSAAPEEMTVEETLLPESVPAAEILDAEFEEEPSQVAFVRRPGDVARAFPRTPAVAKPSASRPSPTATQPVRLPVVAIDAIAGPSDRFRCRLLSASLAASACVTRQDVARAPGHRGEAKRSTLCVDCADGWAVAARLGRRAEAAS